MKTLSRILFAVFFLLLAASAWADKSSPERIGGAVTVNGDEAAKLFNQHSKFIDVRADIDWDAGRVPGAVHLNLAADFNEANLFKVVPKDQPLVIYCNGLKCMRSSQASALAVKWGFKKVFYYRSGFPDWKSRGYPVE